MERWSVGLRPGRGEERGSPPAEPARAGLRAGPEEGLGRPRDVRGAVPAPSPALLLLGSLPEAETCSQSERAGRSGFSSYDGDLSLPLGLALGSPIFPSGCEGKLGVALE